MENSRILWSKKKGRLLAAIAPGSLEMIECGLDVSASYRQPSDSVIVLDASAVMTFFEDRPGAEKVGDLIQLGVQGKRQLLMSVVK